MKLKTKIEEKDGEDSMAALGIDAAQEATAAQTVAAADPLASYAEIAAAGYPKVLCNSCHWEGHSACRYYKKRTSDQEHPPEDRRVLTINL